MKRLRRKRNIFYELRTVRIAISLFVLVSCLVGSIAAFYYRNSTFNYSGSRDSWRAVVRSNSGFLSDQEYLAFKTYDFKARSDERFLSYSHRIAERQQLLSSQSPSDQSLNAFVDLAATFRDTIQEPPLSEADGDSYASAMPNLVQKLVDYANSIDVRSNLSLKAKTLSVASRIAASLDCNYSYSSMMARVDASESILSYLITIQRSDLSPDAKKALIDPCVVKLGQEIRTNTMFKKEQLRLLNSVGILDGKRQVDHNSMNYRAPYQLRFSTVIARELPLVAEAQESRVYAAFADALHTSDGARKEGYMNGDIFCITRFSAQIAKNPASADLIMQLAPELLQSNKQDSIYPMMSNLAKLSHPVVQ